MKTINELQEEIREYNKEPIEIKEGFVMLNPKRELAVRELQTLKAVLKLIDNWFNKIKKDTLETGEDWYRIYNEDLEELKKEIEGNDKR